MGKSLLEKDPPGKPEEFRPSREWAWGTKKPGRPWIMFARRGAISNERIRAAQGPGRLIVIEGGSS